MAVRKLKGVGYDETKKGRYVVAGRGYLAWIDDLDLDVES